MPRCDEFVGRGGCGGFLDGGEDARAGVDPGLPEAAVGGAVGAEVGFHGLEVEVGHPVFDGGGAAEGNDDEFVGVVEGDVACYVGAGESGGVSEKSKGLWIVWDMGSVG